LVFLWDGERALHDRQGEYLPEDAVCILDLFHVMERLWKVAWCFFDEATEKPEAHQWMEKHLRMLLEGKVRYVIGGLRQMVTKRGLKGTRRKAIEEVTGYFRRNCERMKYDEYLAKGYPIGSGVVEGACRHLVKDRLERTRMRWRPEGAQAMLDLRAAYLNEEWVPFWAYTFSISGRTPDGLRRTGTKCIRINRETDFEATRRSSSMKVLITGAAGFIGSTLADRLLDRGDAVVGVDNFDPFYPESRKRANLVGALRDPRFRLVELDIRDADRVEAVISGERPEAIVHLAARAGIRPSIEAPSLYASVNLVGTTNLLEAARRVDPPPRFVYASSSSVYGDRPTSPFRESDPVDLPISPYAASKKACELMAHVFHHVHGLSVTGLRFFTAYGPRNRPDLAIAKFARLIDRGEPVPMFGDGTTRRDYTFIDDIVDGITRAVDRCDGHHLYNLGHSQPIELRAMIEALGEAMGQVPVIQRMPEQSGDVRLTCADISLASAELGYAPGTPFRVGIRRFVEWYREASTA
jgi:UDP-glucuronate 4-epimerase